MIFTRRVHHSDRFGSEFTALDKSLQERIDKSVKKILEKPGLGKPLKRELAGYFSERVGGYRIIYRYDENFVYLERCRKRDRGYR